MHVISIKEAIIIGISVKNEGPGILESDFSIKFTDTNLLQYRLCAISALLFVITNQLQSNPTLI